jgi:hypothetical protein
MRTIIVCAYLNQAAYVRIAGVHNYSLKARLGRCILPTVRYTDSICAVD